MKKKLLAVYLFFSLTLSAIGQDSEIGFVCPPCGCSQDEVFQDTPFACAACGMDAFATLKKDYTPQRTSARNVVPKTVAILLFPGVQIIDYTGPWEVFGQAGWNVFTVAESDEIITTAMNMMVKPHFTLDSVPDYDFLLIPGGNVSSATNSEAVMNWVKEQAGTSEQTMSVCNGAYILGTAGLLDNMKSTTFAPLIPGLRRLAPKSQVVNDERYTDNGKVITSAGLSSGIDAAIYLVSKYQGVANAKRVATHLEYDWDPDKGFVRGLLADMHLEGLGAFIGQFDRELIEYDGDEDQWDVKFLVKTDLTAEDIRRVFAYQVEKGKNWQPTGHEEWTFTTGGKRWTGRLVVNDKDQEKEILLRVFKPGL